MPVILKALTGVGDLSVVTVYPWLIPCPTPQWDRLCQVPMKLLCCVNKFAILQALILCVLYVQYFFYNCTKVNTKD